LAASRKKTPPVQYPGWLGLPHVRIRPSSIFGLLGPNSVEEAKEEAHQKNMEIFGQKMVALAQHYRALSGDDVDWKAMAIGLAFDHVPGFQIVDTPSRKRGRPGRWDFSFEFYRAVLQLLDEGQASVANACRILSRRKGRWNGINPTTLETRFHADKRKIAQLFRGPKIAAVDGAPSSLLGQFLADYARRPSAKYPTLPNMLGLLSLGAAPVKGHKK
jgi:hypothetical protein